MFFGNKTGSDSGNTVVGEGNKIVFGIGNKILPSVVDDAVDYNRRVMDDEYVELRRSNAKILKEELDCLENIYGPIDNFDYRSFWEHAKKISVLFKEMKLFVQDSQELWKEYSDCCDGVRATLDGKNKLKFEYSSKKRCVIEGILKEVDGELSSEEPVGIDDDKYDVLKTKLDIALNMTRKIEGEGVVEGDFSADNLVAWNNVRLLEDDRNIVWHKWSMVKTKLGLVRTGKVGANIAFFNRIQALYDSWDQSDPYDIIKSVKVIQNDIKNTALLSGVKVELRKTLEDLWQKASDAIELNKIHNVGHREGTDQRSVEKQNRYLNLIQKHTLSIQRKQRQIAEAEDRISKPSSDKSSIDSMRAWINTKKEEIAELDREVSELNSKALRAGGVNVASSRRTNK